MTIEEVIKNENVDFTGTPTSYYLLGLISAFENRFQAMADSTMKEEKKNFIEFQADESDKRKQRIILTDSCRRFCEKNNEMSINIMGKMFDGIPEKDMVTTIQTITKIESNLKSLIY